MTVNHLYLFNPSDRQHLYLTQPLASALRDEADYLHDERGGAVHLDFASLVTACRSRTLAEAVAHEAGFENNVLFDRIGGLVNLLNLGPEWVAEVMEDELDHFRQHHIT